MARPSWEFQPRKTQVHPADGRTQRPRTDANVEVGPGTIASARCLLLAALQRGISLRHLSLKSYRGPIYASTFLPTGFRFFLTESRPRRLGFGSIHASSDPTPTMRGLHWHRIRHVATRRHRSFGNSKTLANTSFAFWRHVVLNQMAEHTTLETE